MAGLDKKLLMQILVLILRPAVKFCIRHSLHLQDLIECAKGAFVDAARKDLEDREVKVNVSRVSVMTGVHRPDVLRLLEEGIADNTERDLITRVMGQWRSDRRYRTKSGQPRVLSISGDQNEFAEVCASVSQDINPGTVLFELERVGAVERTRTGLRLVHESYVPKSNVMGGFSILSDDIDTLTETVEENVLDPERLPHLHARTSYDNVRPDALPEIKRWFLKEGHEFHARVREFVSKFDQDINPSPSFKGKGEKVVFTSFSNADSDVKDKS